MRQQQPSPETAAEVPDVVVRVETALFALFLPGCALAGQQHRLPQQHLRAQHDGAYISSPPVGQTPCVLPHVGCQR